MSLVASCQCGQRFAAIPQLAGKTVPCPACGRALTVPTEDLALVPLANDLFVELNHPQFSKSATPVSAGLPPYQPPFGRPAGTGSGLSMNTKVLLGVAAGGGLLLVLIV